MNQQISSQPERTQCPWCPDVSWETPIKVSTKVEIRMRQDAAATHRAYWAAERKAAYKATKGAR
jgi:carboxypeptidase C (cathepsin A)